jgi:hypothetical protein
MSAGQTDAHLEPYDWIAAILCAPIGCVLGLYYLVSGKPKAGKMLLVSILVSVALNLLAVAVLLWDPGHWSTR